MGRPLPGIESARMGLIIDRAFALTGDFGVDLGGGDADVSQELLHLAQFGAAIQQMGGEAVAQRVGRHSLFQAGLTGILLNDEPQPLPGEGMSYPIEKQGRLAGIGEQEGPRF